MHPCNEGFLVTVQVRGVEAQPLYDIGAFYANVSALPATKEEALGCCDSC